MKNFLKLFVLSLLCTLPILSQNTYKDTDDVPGRGRGNTGKILKYNEFFDQSKIPGNPNNAETLTLRANSDTASDLLNEKIIETSKSNNGYLIIKQRGDGKLILRNIILRSNVHLLFDENVNIRFFGESGGTMFSVGEDEKVENVAITCERALGNILNEDFWFNVNLFDGLSGNNGQGRLNSAGIATNRNFCSLGEVINFKLSGIKFDDFYTKINAISLGVRQERNPDGSMKDNRGKRPTRGIISNMTLIRGEGGYGLMQAQNANNTLFYNLKTIDGGVTVRFESGSPASNNVGFVRKGVPNKPVNFKTYKDLFVRKVSSINGTIAMYLNPHRVKQGVIDIDDISSKGSFSTIDIENGFKDFNDKTFITDRFGPALDQFGSFDPKTIITNIKTEPEAGRTAGYSRSSTRYLSCDVFDLIKNKRQGDGTFPFKSLGGIQDNARPLEAKGIGKCETGCYTVNYPKNHELSGVDSNYARGKKGFGVFSEKELLSRIKEDGLICKEQKVNTLGNKFVANPTSTSRTISPNPTKGLVNFEENQPWKLYGFSGALIDSGNGNTADLSNLPNGLYYIKFKSSIRKIIKH